MRAGEGIATSRVESEDFALAPGSVQMAVDSFLLSQAAFREHVVFRVYRMSPPAVTIGRHQRWRRVVDEGACRAHGWEWTRRPTGGGALLHVNELNYAIVARRGILAPVGAGEFRAAFDVIGQTLVAAVQGLGVAAALHSDHRAEPMPQHGLCGRSMTGHEVAWGEQKLVAAAQMITPAGLLQHGTVYLQPPSPTERFWPQAIEETGSSGFVQRWTGLGVEASPSNWTDMAGRFRDNFLAHFPFPCNLLALSAAEMSQIESIRAERQSSGWDRER